MTKNSNFKRRVRSRVSKTGEAYTTARMHLRQEVPNSVPKEKSVRLAVAQMKVNDDPRNVAELRASGDEIRRLMRQAHEARARVVHFPEGSTCAPNKRIMSNDGPDKIGPSDWSRCEWDVLREELEATRVLAQQLKLWTVLGSVHQLSRSQRPHNSLYVISDQGVLTTRYDERLLSNTKISFMYTPGSMPVVFEVDGVRFGCALGMEAHYPEVFGEYERLDVDCVLFSTTGGSSSDETFAAELLGHAASNTYWVSFSMHALPGLKAPAGIAGPDGQWATQCDKEGMPSIAVSEVCNNPDSLARPWRRMVRAGAHKDHQVASDPRSTSRNMF